MNNFLVGLVRKHQPLFLFLIETKSDKGKMEKISRKLGFYNMVIVEAKRNLGGLALLWTDDVILTCNWKFDRIIYGEVFDREKRCGVFLHVMEHFIKVKREFFGKISIISYQHIAFPGSWLEIWMMLLLRKRSFTELFLAHDWKFEWCYLLGRKVWKEKHLEKTYVFKTIFDWFRRNGPWLLWK